MTTLFSGLGFGAMFLGMFWGDMRLSWRFSNFDVTTSYNRSLTNSYDLSFKTGFAIQSLRPFGKTTL